jgi:hypothetical protein
MLEEDDALASANLPFRLISVLELDTVTVTVSLGQHVATLLIWAVQRPRFHMVRTLSVHVVSVDTFRQRALRIWRTT